MRAAIEMQISGEPLAEAAERDIAGYLRYAATPDQLQVTTPMSVTNTTDIAGYSMAVESYEYSKMAMNHLSFESGAGLSLMYGPRLNPGNQSGAAALGLLRLRIQALALQSRAGAAGGASPWVVVPAPPDNPLNRLGFPGLWPQFAEFRAYDPAIEPSREVQTRCTPSGANGGITTTGKYAGSGPAATSDYECNDNSLHLVDRDRQVEKVLAMDALGLSAWKQALWVINYFQLLHDVIGNQLTVVDSTDTTLIGQPGNAVLGDTGDPLAPALPGTYIGASDLEGFQGLVMADEIDNKAELLLKQLLSADGTTLGGFASIKAALGYDYVAPPRWFPHAVAVTEVPGSDGAESQPTAFAILDGQSRLPDLTALLGAYSAFFALTDGKNPEIGGSLTVRPVMVRMVHAVMLSMDQAAAAAERDGGMALTVQAVMVRTVKGKSTASRIGGDPDLPVGAKWPTGKSGPLSFIAQFDLARGILAGDSTRQVELSRDARSTLLSPFPRGVFDFRWLYIDWQTPIGIIRAGQQGSHWGLGMVAEGPLTARSEHWAPSWPHTAKQPPSAATPRCSWARSSPAPTTCVSRRCLRTAKRWTRPNTAWTCRPTGARPCSTTASRWCRWHPVDRTSVTGGAAWNRSSPTSAPGAARTWPRC